MIDMPLMQRQIVKNMIVKHHGSTVAAELEGHVPSVEALERADADLVIFGSEEAELDATYFAWLTRHPRLAVLQLMADGRRAYVWSLRPQREELAEVSEDVLLEAIRRCRAAARDARRRRSPLGFRRR